MSDRDKAVLRNRMILALLTALCSLDCRHWLATAIVALGGIGFFITTALDYWFNRSDS